MSEDEFQIAWAHDILDLEKMLAIIEDCSKECCSCSRDDKDDCRLEIREAVHSLAIIVKTAILSIVEASTKEKEEVEEKATPPMYS